MSNINREHLTLENQLKAQKMLIVQYVQSTVKTFSNTWNVGATEKVAYEY